VPLAVSHSAISHLPLAASLVRCVLGGMDFNNGQPHACGVTNDHSILLLFVTMIFIYDYNCTVLWSAFACWMSACCLSKDVGGNKLAVVLEAKTKHSSHVPHLAGSLYTHAHTHTHTHIHTRTHTRAHIPHPPTHNQQHNRPTFWLEHF